MPAFDDSSSDIHEYPLAVRAKNVFGPMPLGTGWWEK
jgi:hypothetical protein